MLRHSKSVAKSTNQTRRAGRHSATDPDSFWGRRNWKTTTTTTITTTTITSHLLNFEHSKSTAVNQAVPFSTVRCFPCAVLYLLLVYLLAEETHSVAVGVGEDVQQRRPVAQTGSWQASYIPNSKHWFTTSFLQPLPYLVTP